MRSDWFRKNRLPIIVIYHESEEDGALPGTKPFEVNDSVRIEETDIKVTKHYPNAFGKTELAAILKREGCDTVAIVGLSASGCILATYFGAMDHDIHPYLVQGGVASHNEGHVRFAEDEICQTLTVQAFEQSITSTSLSRQS